MMESLERFTPQSDRTPDRLKEKEQGTKITGEIIQYRFQNEIREQVENLINFTDKLGQEGNISFNKDFQQQYIDYKLKIASYVDDLKDFLKHPENEKKDKLIEKIIAERTFVEASSKIKSELEDYMKQSDVLSKYLKTYNSEEVFRNVAGESPKGLIEATQEGNALVLHVYSDDDYNKLYGDKKSEASLSVGFFQVARQIWNDKDKIIRPLVVIRSGMKDELYFHLAEIYKDEYYDEYLPEVWEELTSKKLHDEENGDEIQHHFSEFEQWRLNIPKEYSLESFILDKIQFGSSIEYDMELQEEINDWETKKNIILTHEKQHFSYNYLIFEGEDKNYELSLGHEQVKEYLQDVLGNYIKNLGDEIIAYTKDNISNWENIRDEYDEDEVFNFDEKRTSHKFKVGSSSKLSNKLYFYPRMKKKAVFEEIKAEIGKEKFREWDVENLWDKIVVKPFAKKKKQLEKVGAFFLKKVAEEDNAKSKKILGLLEVEPVESWPRLYYWFRNNPDLFDRITK